MMEMLVMKSIKLDTKAIETYSVPVKDELLLYNGNSIYVVAFLGTSPVLGGYYSKADGKMLEDPNKEFVFESDSNNHLFRKATEEEFNEMAIALYLADGPFNRAYDALPLAPEEIRTASQSFGKLTYEQYSA